MDAIPSAGNPTTRANIAAAPGLAIKKPGVAGLFRVAIDRLVGVRVVAGRLAELVRELVGVTADGVVEDLQHVRVLRIAQHVALADVFESGRLDLLPDDRRIDAMQRLGVAQPGPASATWSITI